MDIAFDAIGDTLYHTFTRCMSNSPNNPCVEFDTQNQRWVEKAGARQSTIEMWKIKVGGHLSELILTDGPRSPLDTGAAMSIMASSHLGLSMEPLARKLVVLNARQQRVLKVAVTRPAGPWGAEKKCRVDGTCACLAGYSGDRCNGDQCPNDVLKISPGLCGCGSADIDQNGNPVTDPQQCAL